MARARLAKIAMAALLAATIRGVIRHMVGGQGRTNTPTDLAHVNSNEGTASDHQFEGTSPMKPRADRTRRVGSRSPHITVALVLLLTMAVVAAIFWPSALSLSVVRFFNLPAAVALLLLITLFLWKLPQWQVGSWKEGLEPQDLAKAESEARTSWLQIVGALVAIGGLLSAAGVRLQQTQNEQISDRFTTATTQLGQAGPENLGMRLGGILTLERVSKDAPSYQGPVMEVLTAFVRQEARMTENAVDMQNPPSYATVEVIPIDIQTILTVIARRDPKHDSKRCIDLSGTNLAYADLSGARFPRICLHGANLYRAILTEADLSGANLSDANLERADLSGANLERADLSGAKLTGAFLSEANLTGAILTGANLESVFDATDEQICSAVIDFEVQTKLPLFFQGCPNAAPTAAASLRMLPNEGLRSRTRPPLAASCGTSHRDQGSFGTNDCRLLVRGNAVLGQS